MLVYRYHKTFASRDSAISWAASHPEFKYPMEHYLGFYKERGGYVHCEGMGPNRWLVFEYAGGHDAVEKISVERNIEIWAVLEDRPPKPIEWPSRRQPAAVPGWRYNFDTLIWEPVAMPEQLIELEVDLLCWRIKKTGHLVWAFAEYMGFATHVGPNTFVLKP